MPLRLRRADLQYPEAGWPASDDNLVVLHGETVIGSLRRIDGGPSTNRWSWSITALYVPPGTMTLGDGTRATLTAYILESGKGPSECLFTSARSPLPLTRRHYGRLVKDWAGLVGIQDVAAFSTHSLRRTRAAFIYEQTKDLEVVRQVLGHKSLSATQAYLGVNEAKAHDIAGKYRL